MKYKPWILNSWGSINVRSIQFLHVHKITTEPIKHIWFNIWNYAASQSPRQTSRPSASSRILRSQNTCDRKKQNCICIQVNSSRHSENASQHSFQNVQYFHLQSKYLKQKITKQYYYFLILLAWNVTFAQSDGKIGRVSEKECLEEYFDLSGRKHQKIPWWGFT